MQCPFNLETAMNNMWIKSIIGTLMVGGLALGLSANADAEGVSAFSGQPQQPSQYGCFTNGNGGVGNSCSYTAQYCIPLDVNQNGNHNVTVSVLSPDVNHNVGCFAQSVTQSSASYSWSGWQYPSAFGSPQVLNLGAVPSPSGGTTYVCCNIPPHASVYTVNYSL
jgi:hypothetical protein